MDNLLSEDWTVLRHWLPEDLAELAKRGGFTQRARGVQDVEVWLRLMLLHVGGGLSLEQTVMRAGELGLAQVSAVALHKRMLRAGAWLQELTAAMLARRVVPAKASRDWRANVVVVDATTVQEPGSTGTDWRVHYRVRLSDLRCEDYELTDAHEGEGLGRHSFQAEQIVIADRGYCHRAGAGHVLSSGAQLVLRLHPRLFPLERSDGEPFALCPWTRSLRGHRPAECDVWFRQGKKRCRLRLCAIRKSRTATLRAQKKQRTKASRMGYAIEPASTELAGFVLILTSLPRADWPTGRVLQLYRQRWQVELVFKRLKSLLGIGHLPKTNDQSARAWMQAKILTALLIERAMHEARFFSPWGFALTSEPLGSVPRGA